MHSKKAIRQKAMDCLERYGVNKAAIDVEEIARCLGIRVLEKDTESDNVSGLLSISQDSATIVVNEAHHPNRKRFTIAHELGHYFLHADQGTELFLDSPTYYRSAASSEGYDPIEVEANQFAAELLMPIHFMEAAMAKTMHNFMDDDNENLIDDLAKQFEVSPAAMSIRLGKLALG